MVKHFRPYLQVLPVVALLLFLMVGGISGALLQSLGYFPFLGMKSFTLEFYKRVLCDRVFLSSFLYTLKICAVSSFISLALGVLLAKCLVEAGEGRWPFFYKIPLIIPHVTVALFAVTFLSGNGVLARILHLCGVRGARGVFDSVLFSPSGAGVIAAYVWKEAPFVLLTVYALMGRISSRHEKIAVNLGAGRVYAFFRVVLPMIMPAVLSCFVIIFSYSFGAYELPVLIGSTVPRALPVQAFIEYQSPLPENRPYAMAYCVILGVTSVLCMSVLYALLKRLGGGKR